DLVQHFGSRTDLAANTYCVTRCSVGHPWQAPVITCFADYFHLSPCGKKAIDAHEQVHVRQFLDRCSSYMDCLALSRFFADSLECEAWMDTETAIKRLQKDPCCQSSRDQQDLRQLLRATIHENIPYFCGWRKIVPIL
ncbi:MAG TPA: hypothetical protein PKH07_20740, partial [bacterium]|nr:hypothetical protein [bacterium]